jgi:hypothetical protein
VNRRQFVRSLGTLAVAGAVPRVLARGAATEPWRKFEITTHVHVQNADGLTRAWLPTPLAVAPYQKTLGDTYHVEGGTVSMVEREEIDLLAAEWPAGAEPILTLTSRVSTAEAGVDFDTPTVAPPRDFSAFTRFLRAGPAAAIDGLKKTAAALTRGAGTDLERARALYDGVAADPARAAAADANARYVSLVRASGIPARIVYGLRLDAANATRAQTSRAEVYLVGFGWVPVDLTDRRRFGSWGAAWMAYNTAQDVVLPGSSRGALAYVMHPQAETGQRRVDSLDADAFRYEISVRSIDA